MKEKTETFNQGKRYFFYILMFAILGWFIFMQIFGADERSSDTSAASVIYSGTVVLCQEKVQIKYNQFSLFM